MIYINHKKIGFILWLLKGFFDYLCLWIAAVLSILWGGVALDSLLGLHFADTAIMIIAWIVAVFVGVHVYHVFLHPISSYIKWSKNYNSEQPNTKNAIELSKMFNGL